MKGNISRSAAQKAADRSVINFAKFTRQNSRLYPYLLMLPAVIPMAILVFYPVFYMLYLSGHHHLIIRPNDIRFIGIENYLHLIVDEEFWESLRISGIWVAGSVIPQFLMGLGMALLLNQVFRGRGLARTIMLAPWVLSGVITGIIWVWLFDGTIGVINDLLIKLDLIARPIAWTIRPSTSFLTLFVANAWRGAPFFAITLLAALQGIDPEIYEAAAIDGANGWGRFRYITIPLIATTAVVTTLLRAIWTFNWIDLIFTMTKGGPLNSTRSLAMYIFDTAYIDGDFGYAATLSIALCLILLIFSAFYWQLNRFVER